MKEKRNMSFMMLFRGLTIVAGAALSLFLIAPGAAALEPVSLDAPELPEQAMSSDSGGEKDYLIPAIEIPAFVAGLNGFDRLVIAEEKDGEKIFNSNLSTFWKNTVESRWSADLDPFDTNQIAHPYMGTLFHGFARSAGLNYWESFVYTFVGSYLWETAGETLPPSVNDQVASGIAGSFFGEPLFRMASLILEGGGGKPGIWRELGAAALSLPTGFNRFAFGDRFKPVFKSHDPALFWRLRAGGSMNSHGSSTVTANMPTAGFDIAYGLPGKPGYSYTRPFDYFSMEFTVLGHSKNSIENVMVQGLLLGEEYEAGNNYRGIWGLYGNYDYLAPHVFKASSTAASLGTTFQWRLAPGTALQGSVSGGIGYGAAGVDVPDTRTYRYGLTFQGLAALRLSLGDAALLEAGGREYYVSSLGGTNPDGSELISRFNAGLTVRIHGKHALGIQYLSSLRDADTAGRPGRRQSVETVSLLYTFLSDSRFGAVEWPVPPE